jgi:hypothetical protein
MSLAMMSNRIAEEQCEQLVQYAKQYSDSRVGIMHVADVPGDEGAKETLWRMHEAGINAYLVWSRRMHSGQFADRQPESLSKPEWDEIVITCAKTKGQL